VRVRGHGVFFFVVVFFFFFFFFFFFDEREDHDLAVRGKGMRRRRRSIAHDHWKKTRRPLG
jgi:hypothetical protein